jgi:hypothetical protein
MVACVGTYLITPLRSSTFTAAKRGCFVFLFCGFVLFYFVLFWGFVWP